MTPWEMCVICLAPSTAPICKDCGPQLAALEASCNGCQKPITEENYGTSFGQGVVYCDTCTGKD